jgi:hypothetical protein
MTTEKPYTLVGFEPGSSVPKANAISTLPRCQGIESRLCRAWVHIKKPVVTYDLCKSSVTSSAR